MAFGRISLQRQTVLVDGINSHKVSLVYSHRGHISDLLEILE